MHNIPKRKIIEEFYFEKPFVQKLTVVVITVIVLRSRCMQYLYLYKSPVHNSNHKACSRYLEPLFYSWMRRKLLNIEAMFLIAVPLSQVICCSSTLKQDSGRPGLWHSLYVVYLRDLAVLSWKLSLHCKNRSRFRSR